jgi:hypothetical protein
MKRFFSQTAKQSLHEFRSFKSGEEERHDLIKSGIIGTGIAAAGGLAGLGLYKSGVSSATKNADRLGGIIKKISQFKKGNIVAGRAAEAKAVKVAGNQESAFKKAAEKFYGGNSQARHASQASAVAKAQNKATASAAKVASPATPSTPPPAALIAAEPPVAPTPTTPLVASKGKKRVGTSGGGKIYGRSLGVHPALAPVANKTTIPAGVFKPEGSAAEVPAKVLGTSKDTYKGTPLEGGVSEKLRRVAQIDNESAAPTKPAVVRSRNGTMRKLPQPKEPVAETVAAVSKVKGGYVRPGSSGTGESIQKLITAAKPSAQSPKPLKVVANPVAADPKTPAKATKPPAAKQTPASPVVARPAAAKQTPAVPKEPKIVKSKVSALKNEDTFLEIGNQKVVLTGSAADQQKQAAEWTRRHKNGELKGRNLADVGDEIRGKRDFSAYLRNIRYFDQFQADEAGIPLTGRVAHDRFVKKIRDEDLDRRDANLLRAGLAGGAAGALFRGKLGVGKRALIGAGLGGLGVLGVRQITKSDRDIYGERNRSSKRAELIPAVGGLGAAAWLAGKRLKAFAKKFNHGGHGGLKEFSILNKISNLTGIAQIKAGREALEKAKWARKNPLIAVARRSDGSGVGFPQFPHAREATREARSFINEGVRRRNISIGVAGAAGVVGGGLAHQHFGRGQGPARSKQLAAKLRGLREFGVVSVETAKKVFRGLGKGDIPKSLRPNISSLLEAPMGAMYVPRGTPLEARSQIASTFGGPFGGRRSKAFDPHTVIVPRANESLRSSNKSILGGMLADPIGTSLHEHGHAADSILPRAGQAMGKRAKRLGSAMASGDFDAADRLGKGMGRVALRAERRANQNVLKQIQTHGTGEEVKAWKQWANKQMKHGYRNSMYQAASAEVGADTLAKKKALLREMPMLRSKFTNLAARLESLSLMHFCQTRAVRYFAEKKKRELNPYVGAALSGGASGAALGGLSILKHGVSPMSALKSAGYAGAAAAGIVGGGALLGSKLIGKPRPEESAPFSKRAAIGGALAGAGAGLIGAIALKKTRSGRQLVDGWDKGTGLMGRPASWIKGSNLAGAMALGGVGGGIAGAAQGADEGQQVDSIRNLKKDMKKFSRKEFGYDTQARDKYTKAFVKPVPAWITGRETINSDGTKWEASSPQLINAVLRDAKSKRVLVQRGGRLTGDVASVLQGKDRQRDASGRIKKREWEKSWFKNKATEYGLAAGGLGVAALARYGHNNPGTYIGKAYKKSISSYKKTKDDAAGVLSNIYTGLNDMTKKRFSSRLARLLELDAYANYAGWDVRDARGKSARVFAPGSRQRERRPKEWHEKAENERALWKAKVAAAAVGGAGAALIGSRILSGKSLIPSRFVKKPPAASVFVDASDMFKRGNGAA